MVTVRLLTIITALLIAGCAALPVNAIPASPGQPPSSNNLRTTTAPLAPPASVPNPIAIIKKYYAAVSEKAIDRAVLFLSYDVVLVEIPASPCAWYVVSGQQAIKSQLEHSNVLSFTVEDFQVNSSRTMYTLTEWLDPRVVGPNFHQPVRSYATAVVEYGAVTNLTLMRDNRQFGKEGESDSAACSRF